MKRLMYAGLYALLLGITPASLLAQTPPANPSPPATNAPAGGDDTQLSFQGANIDAVVQWLAKTTGKSVVKHPKVQCQLTIVSSKKLTQRDALNLVYRALALEGFNVIESSKSVLIVPEGTDPRIQPELVDNGKTEVPEGRQRLIKIFTLQNVPAADVQSKVKAVLSEKAVVEVSGGNQLMVTDYNDNLRVAGELIKELDVASPSETVIEFFTLKHAEAEELGTLLGYVLNAQAAPPSPPSSSSSRSTRSSSSSSFNPFESSSSSPSPPSSSSSSAPTPPASAAQGVKIWPDKVANRLIVSAPKSRMPEVKKLIELLDTEKPQDVAIRVIQLKHVSSEDLVRDIQPLYQKISGRSIKDIIEVGANSRANSVIVLSSESNFKGIEKLIQMLDTEEAQEKVIETFPLKNADAEEVAKQLQELNSDQGGTGRYPFYFVSYSSMGSRQPVKPTFVADRRRNTVIVQAPPAILENVRGMIAALDEPVTDDSLAPRIFRLKFVSAQDIEEILNELFLKRTQQRQYWDPYGFPGTSRESDQSAGKLFGKVRITSEPYANAIIVTANSAENLEAVEEVLKQLDQPSQAGESTLRIELRFAQAATVANSLNILFARNGSPPLRGGTQQQGQQQNNQQQNQNNQQQNTRTQSDFALEQEAREESYFPWIGGQQDQQRTPDGRSLIRPVSDLVGRVRIVPDHRANGLLVSATSHFFPQILRLIKELDSPTAQVLIEARIVEVSSDFLDKLGVRWSPDGSATFTADDLDNSILIRTRGQYAENFGENSSALANSLRAGVLSSSINLDFLIQFLRKTTDATVLAEPQINIADNEVGKLFVGQQVPFINNSQNTAEGSLNQSFSYKDVGVILEVTPHINNDGDVALKIRAESSSIVPGQTLFGGAILDTRNFKTDLTCKNGQTLVLGGIIQKQVSDTLRKTPLLGSIPGLGWFFKKKDNVRREVELMVFLRPRVVRTPEEAQELLEETDRKAPLIKGWRTGTPENGEKSPDSK